MWRNGDWGWWFLMPLLMLGFWAAVVWVVAAAVRRKPVGASPTAPSAHDPEQILAERYARGDIDDEEYRRRLDTLRGRTPVGDDR